MSFFGGGSNKSAEQAAAQARADEAARQGKLATGRTNIDNAFSQFDDPYYSKRATDYDAFAMPQLDEQFGNTKKQLVYALSRGGLLNSSTAAEKNKDLTTQYERNKQLVESKGEDYATQARKDVADSRSRLLGDLASTEDPSTVGDEAARQAVTLSQAPSYDPLGNLFSDISGTIAKVQNARNLGGAFNSGTSLFSSGTGGGSGRVVSN